MSKFTPEDFKAFETVIGDVLDKKLEPIHERIHEHQKSVDAYIKQTAGWHDEQLIIAKKLERMNEVLVNKGIATPEELAI